MPKVLGRHPNELAESLAVASFVEELRYQPAARLPVVIAHKWTLVEPKRELDYPDPGIAPQTL
ncbi:MAG: hypothetical protein WDO73_24900 [Ignavibacteriota bacterium]